MQLRSSQQQELVTNNENDLINATKKKKKDHNDGLTGHRLSVTCLCVDVNDKYAYTGSKDGFIIKWSVKDRKILAKIKSISKKDYDKLNQDEQKKHHTKHINCLAISSDDQFLASGGFDKHIRIWNPLDLTWLHSFTMHKFEITSLVFRVGHPMLYSGSTDRSVMLWTLEDDDNRCFVESLYGHESPITSIDALRRERILTSGGRDQSVRIWKVVEQAQTVFESKHESADIARLIDDQMFVSGGEDGAICVWTTMKRTPVLSLKNAHKPEKPIMQGLTYWISALATHSLKKVTEPTHATKKRKITGGEDEDDVLIAKYGDDDEQDDDEVDEDKEEDGDETINQQDTENDGDTTKNAIALVASGSCDSIIRVWKLLRSGSKFELELYQSIECPGFVNDLRFSSDGRRLLAACGQEHRFGRWWKLRHSKNTLRIFHVKKCN